MVHDYQLLPPGVKTCRSYVYTGQVCPCHPIYSCDISLLFKVSVLQGDHQSGSTLEPEAQTGGARHGHVIQYEGAQRFL